MISGVPPHGGIPPGARRRRMDNKGITIPLKLNIGLGGVDRRVVAPKKDTFVAHSKPKGIKSSTKTLENLLDWGNEEYQKCINMLNILSPDMVEYQELLSRVDNVRDAIEQTKRQLALRRQ